MGSYENNILCIPSKNLTNNKGATGRIKYEPVSRYSNKTLLGSWSEELFCYQKENLHHISTYTNDYVPKPNSTEDADITWDSIFKGAGYGERLLFDHGGDHYIKNYSTTYDLSYNHLPKILKMHPVIRTWKVSRDHWLPEQDLTRNYRNITDYGITTYKRQVWQDQKSDPRVTATTVYQDTFMPPLDKDRQFKRWAVPKKNSTLLHSNNIVTNYLRLRAMPTHNVTPNEEIIVVPRPKRCNPITWECYGNEPKESKRLAK